MCIYVCTYANVLHMQMPMIHIQADDTHDAQSGQYTKPTGVAGAGRGRDADDGWRGGIGGGGARRAISAYGRVTDVDVSSPGDECKRVLGGRARTAGGGDGPSVGGAEVRGSGDREWERMTRYVGERSPDSEHAGSDRGERAFAGGLSPGGPQGARQTGGLVTQARQGEEREIRGVASAGMVRERVGQHR